VETSSNSLNNQTELTGTTSTSTSKNAYSRFFCNPPFLAANFFCILPAQRPKTTTSSTKYASVPTVSGDNPVNSWDPSGYATMGPIYPAPTTTTTEPKNLLVLQAKNRSTYYLYISPGVKSVSAQVTNEQPSISSAPGYSSPLDVEFCSDGPFSEPATMSDCTPNGSVSVGTTSMLMLSNNGSFAGGSLYFFGVQSGNPNHFPPLPSYSFNPPQSVNGNTSPLPPDCTGWDDCNTDGSEFSSDASYSTSSNSSSSLEQCSYLENIGVYISVKSATHFGFKPPGITVFHFS
jgi:hypothetical protein